MNGFITKLLERRFVCFLVGLTIFPVFLGLRALVRPTAKDAMGFVGFYEENYSVYTLLGDHTYSLGFPGDKERFKRYVKRMGLSKHKVSDTEFRKEDSKGQRSYGVVFDSGDKLRTIRYFSYSQ